MFDAIVNDIKYVEVAHARYESFMSNRTWRSSGGIIDNDGVVVLCTETGAEEYLSGFKYIQLFNTDYSGGTPPRHVPNQIPKKSLLRV